LGHHEHPSLQNSAGEAQNMEAQHRSGDGVPRKASFAGNPETGCTADNKPYYDVSVAEGVSTSPIARIDLGVPSECPETTPC
jgi:hypothetical protein